ncbi:MAG: DKNYY domain-containing protein [Sphingobacteriales bacterium]|nr:DKNYY domain-containing protein [Sphingobacteriales bacterium]
MRKPIITLLILLALCVVSCNNKIESYGPYSIFKKIDDSLTFILTVDNEDESYSYHSNIKLDLKTLVNYHQFFVDKSEAYRKYEMDGDCKIIPIKEADLPTFHVLDNSIYAKDKNHVYDCRNGIITKADVSSFEAINIEGKYSFVTGKDKHHFYFWDKFVTDTTGISRYLKKHD